MLFETKYALEMVVKKIQDLNYEPVKVKLFLQKLVVANDLRLDKVTCYPGGFVGREADNEDF